MIQSYIFKIFAIYTDKKIKDPKKYKLKWKNWLQYWNHLMNLGINKDSNLPLDQNHSGYKC